MIREINIKDSHIPELIEIFGEGYEATILIDGVDTPNPQTKVQFAGDNFDNSVIGHIGRTVQRHRKQAAANSINTDTITE